MERIGAPTTGAGLKAKLDYDDYAAIPPDRNRYEIIDGELYVTPSPTPDHQHASKRLQRILESYFEERGLGEVFDAPLDLIMTKHDVVQPDLLVVNPVQVSGRGIEGAPLLVVEILSPSTRAHDRDVKARRYAALSVPHYWIVDPADRRVECYEIRGATYALVSAAQDRAILTHPAWPDLVVPLAGLWRG
jgi:Uma2 family endonuclease